MFARRVLLIILLIYLLTYLNLSPGDVVLDEVAAYEVPIKGVQPPILRPMSVVAKQLDASKCHLVRR